MKRVIRYLYKYIVVTKIAEFLRKVKRIIFYKVRYDNIIKYKGIHKGERCFIIATGPSLTIDDVEILKDEYTFGMNSGIYLIEKSSWSPTYYLLQDKKVYEKLKNDLAIIDNCSVIKFIGDTATQKTSKKDVLYSLRLYNHFVGGTKVDFSEDCHVYVSDGWTVTYSAIQIAVYMGFSEIYLLGCDSDYSGKMHAEHCVKTGDKEKMVKGQEKFGEFSSIAYECAQCYALKRGAKIYNCTRGGKLEVFPRKTLEDVLQTKLRKEK